MSLNKKKHFMKQIVKKLQTKHFWCKNEFIEKDFLRKLSVYLSPMLNEIEAKTMLELDTMVHNKDDEKIDVTSSLFSNKELKTVKKAIVFSLSKCACCVLKYQEFRRINYTESLKGFFDKIEQTRCKEGLANTAPLIIFEIMNGNWELIIDQETRENWYLRIKEVLNKGYCPFKYNFSVICMLLGDKELTKYSSALTDYFYQKNEFFLYSTNKEWSFLINIYKDFMFKDNFDENYEQKIIEFIHTYLLAEGSFVNTDLYELLNIHYQETNNESIKFALFKILVCLYRKIKILNEFAKEIIVDITETDILQQTLEKEYENVENDHMVEFSDIDYVLESFKIYCKSDCQDLILTILQKVKDPNLTDKIYEYLTKNTYYITKIEHFIKNNMFFENVMLKIFTKHLHNIINDNHRIFIKQCAIQTIKLTYQTFETNDFTDIYTIYNSWNTNLINVLQSIEQSQDLGSIHILIVPFIEMFFYDIGSFFTKQEPNFFALYNSMKQNFIKIWLLVKADCKLCIRNEIYKNFIISKPNLFLYINNTKIMLNKISKFINKYKIVIPNLADVLRYAVNEQFDFDILTSLLYLAKYTDDDRYIINYYIDKMNCNIKTDAIKGFLATLKKEKCDAQKLKTHIKSLYRKVKTLQEPPKNMCFIDDEDIFECVRDYLSSDSDSANKSADEMIDSDISDAKTASNTSHSDYGITSSHQSSGSDIDSKKNDLNQSVVVDESSVSSSHEENTKLNVETQNEKHEDAENIDLQEDTVAQNDDNYKKHDTEDSDANISNESVEISKKKADALENTFGLKQTQSFTARITQKSRERIDNSTQKLENGFTQEIQPKTIKNTVSSGYTNLVHSNVGNALLYKRKNSAPTINDSYKPRIPQNDLNSDSAYKSMRILDDDAPNKNTITQNEPKRSIYAKTKDNLDDYIIPTNRQPMTRNILDKYQNSSNYNKDSVSSKNLAVTNQHKKRLWDGNSYEIDVKTIKSTNSKTCADQKFTPFEYKKPIPATTQNEKAPLNSFVYQKTTFVPLKKKCEKVPETTKFIFNQGKNTDNLGAVKPRSIKSQLITKPQSTVETPMSANYFSPYKFLENNLLPPRKKAPKDKLVFEYLNFYDLVLYKNTYSKPNNKPEYKFDSLLDYKNYFEPLLLNEIHANIEKETKLYKTFSSLNFYIEKVHHDKTHTELILRSDAMSNLLENDCIYIKSSNFVNKDEVLAIVKSIDSRRNAYFLTVLVKNRIAPFEKNQRIQYSYVINLTTFLREYQAIFNLEDFAYKDLVLNPQTVQKQNDIHSTQNILSIQDKLKINESQSEAVLNCIDYTKRFVLIQGPPGTGKTTTIISILSAFFSNQIVFSRINEKSRVLICAPSNTAIDEVAKRVIKEGVLCFDGKKIQPSILRVGVATNMCTTLKSISLEILLDQLNCQTASVKNLMRLKFLEDSEIIFTTLSSSALDCLSQKNLNLDLLIVDEACQCVETSCIIPLKYNPKKVILIGDPKQLPPTTISNSNLYEYSLFQRFSKSFPFSLLKIQYRMASEIAAYPNARFYYSQLITDDSCNTRYNPYKNYINCVNFVNVNGNEIVNKSFGYYNEIEARCVVNFVSLLCKKIDINQNIAIISPYKAQVSYITDMFVHDEVCRNFLDKICINTVDAFQGQEKDLVIISMVRTNKIGFVNDKRRLNVSLTRAKFGVVIFGNSALLSEDIIWRELIQFYAKRNNFWNVTEFFNVLKKKIESF